MNLNKELVRLQEQVDLLRTVSDDELARTVKKIRADAERAAEAAAGVDLHYRALVEQFGQALIETRRTVHQLENRISLMGGVSFWRILTSKLRILIGGLGRWSRRVLVTSKRPFVRSKST